MRLRAGAYPDQIAKTSGSDTFNGTAGRVIPYQLKAGGSGTEIISITPTAALAGRWYIAKGNQSFTVFSTDSSDTGTFDWLVARES